MYTPIPKRIILREQREAEAAAIQKQLNIHPVAARVLAARGFKPDEDLAKFLNPTLKDGLPSPKLLKNLDKAAALIAETVKRKDQLAVCCDFDVDGLSGGAQVVHFLRLAGATVEAVVPDRFTEGYGLNSEIIERLAAQGVKLLITVDFGTTNKKELELARERGLKTVVVDHHHVGETICPADVFVNPQQSDCGFANGILSASGLAFYLVLALKDLLEVPSTIDYRTYLELACLGTICDMVPLTGVNRVIAKRGLERLAETRRPGLMSLKNVLNLHKSVSCTDVSFGIGPRLNAAGRMVHGNLVLELLTSSDTDKCDSLARRLHRLNVERQDVETMVKERALELVFERGASRAGHVVWDKEFHTGVIGIVAQRVVETFYRPTAVLGLDTEGIYKGSVRGIRGFNVVEALGNVGEHLLKFGGHSGAGGFSVKEENLKALAEAFETECARQLCDAEMGPVVEVDAEIALNELTVDLVDQLKAFAPFGMGNPAPVLLARGLKVVETRVLKDTHLKSTLTDGRKIVSAMMWRQPQHAALRTGNTVDVAFRAEVNTFNGLTEVQAVVQTARVAEAA